MAGSKGNAPAFGLGDAVVFTRKTKIYMVDKTVINVPAGTRGQVLEASPDAYTIKCAPATTHFEPSFVVGAEEEAFLAGVALARDVATTAWPSLKEQAIYDNDMPGYLRGDNGYVMTKRKKGEKAYFLYQRKAWTDWRVEVHFYKGVNVAVTGVFRTAWVESKECEQFTLLPEKHDFTLVQVQMMDESKVRAFAYVPAGVMLDAGQNLVTISLLCNVEFEGGRVVVLPLPEW